MTEQGQFDHENILKAVAKEFAFEEKEIDNAMKKHLFKSAGDFVDHLWVQWEKRLKDPLRKICEETKWISREQRCLSCKKKARDTVFLPCGDFILCHCCAMAVTECPYCDEKITDLVQTALTDESSSYAVDNVHPHLLKETSHLYRERMCVYCKNEERRVVFLPCSHLAACCQCAPRFEKCICGEKIECSVLTFLS